jgi:hypothetical protein
MGYSGEIDNADEHIPKDGVLLLPAGKYYVQVFHRSSGGSTQPYNLRVVYK